MGYDMYVRHQSGKKLADLIAPWDERPDEDAPREEHIEWFDQRLTPLTYLRRSIGGQGPFRDMLKEVGAAFDDYDFETGWARIAGLEPHVMGNTGPEYPGDDHFAQNVDSFERVAITEEGKRYEAELEAYLKWRPERPGIPLHKLGDNSGWWVTKIECEEALEAIEKYREEHGSLPVPPDYEWDPWSDVIPFLKSAAANDGFTVH